MKFMTETDLGILTQAPNEAWRICDNALWDVG